MKTVISYPRVQDVTALAEKRLLVVFSSGERKVYDCSPLLDEEVFRPLADETLFHSVRSDPHGYGVIWNDAIDLSESELWIHGTPFVAEKELEPPHGPVSGHGTAPSARGQ